MVENNNAEFKYRLIYESLSRFSGSLGKCNTFNSIANCLHTNIKYILDYKLMRFVFYQHQSFINYTLTPTTCNCQRNEKNWYFNDEQMLYEKGVPVNKKVDKEISENLELRNIRFNKNDKQLYGWNFILGANSGIIVTLITDAANYFAQSDIAVIKLVIENLYSRLHTLLLIEELDSKKNELQKTVLELKTVHAKVSTLAARQDIIIKERTAKLNESNKKLLELSKLNTHNLREPLARILGLLYLLEEHQPGVSLNDYLPMLQQSSADLDKAIQNTVLFIDEQILKLKEHEM